ncbi:UPF0102 protein yraN [Thalassoporum mexicanum PCC 7367]|uniref:YraN family protein n=1 Tax=Thalassoporum mexicanum TaxID=3457544 RepID=UPI00029F9E27|nr:YraN family protein [Pseudanabaena sp. PCC 7367]AFY71152.1 UPF0102 protein yraN [Pseudanabaena sp. PCC 7367]
MARSLSQSRSHLSKQYKTGWQGEAFVEKLLTQNGWQILGQRWRCKSGEIDLIARDRQTIIFVEVKTRSDRNLDHNGSLAITLPKQKRLYQAALEFIAQNQELGDYILRFDVALVHKNQNDQFRLYSYIESAFSTTTLA